MPPLILEVTGRHLDPAGRYVVDGTVPSAPGWETGDRTGNCGVGRGTRTDEVHPLKVGRFADLDDAVFRPVGQCVLAGTSTPTTECDGAHASEITGIVDVTGRTTAPEGDELWGLAAELCTGLGERYVGGPLPDGVTPSIWAIPETSWDLGVRRTECGITSRADDGTAVDGIERSLRRTDVAAVPGQCLDELDAIVDCNVPHHAEVSAIAGPGASSTDCLDETATFLGAGRPRGFDIATEALGPLCVILRAGGGLLPAGTLQALQGQVTPQPDLVDAGPATSDLPGQSERSGRNAAAERSATQPRQTPVP